MIRASRVLLGNAAKTSRAKKELDLDGKSIPAGSASWYYTWWLALHCLCDKEGLDADVYWHHPSRETKLCEGHGFKMFSHAVIHFLGGSRFGGFFLIRSGERNEPGRFRRPVLISFSFCYRKP